MYSYLELLAYAAHLSLLTTVILFIFNKKFAGRFCHYFELPSPSTGASYMTMDILRGLSALWVAAFHAAQWKYPLNRDMATIFLANAKGVAIFSILSGFLIYRSLKDRELNAKVITEYARRRFFRIYPLLFVTIAISFTLRSLDQLVEFTLYDVISDFLLIRTFTGECCVNPPAWSLTVEVIFYISLPLLLYFLKRRFLTALAATLMILFFAESFYSYSREVTLAKYFIIGIFASEGYDRMQQLPGRRLLQLSLSMIIASLAIFYLDIWRQVDIFGLAIDFVLTTAGITDSFNSSTYLRFPFATGVAGAGLLVGLINMERYSNRLVEIAVYPFRFLGVISYSIYLWHSIIIITELNPILGQLFNIKPNSTPQEPGDFYTLFFIYFPAIILVSSLSYLWIERPFLQRGRRTP